tara:strand:+ start:531 stop:755 length:225 start_codon:yes stop_codon:yes gene_type:complete
MDYVELFESVACKQAYKMADGVNAVARQVKIDVLTNLREAIQPDGLINSDAGTKTIKSITNAIDVIIEQENKDT